MTEQSLTEQELAAMETDLSFRLLQGESRRGLERLTGEVRRLQEQEKRLLVMLAWTKGLIPSGGAPYEACHRYMDRHNIHGDDFAVVADRGRALVEKQQKEEACE